MVCSSKKLEEALLTRKGRNTRQNIPRLEGDKFELRKAFIAGPGETLTVSDYEQLEMRVLAALAKEQDMLDIFKRDWDIHMGNASLVFGLPYDDIKKAKKLESAIKKGTANPSEMTEYLHKCLNARQAAKAIGFGLNYGMKARALSKRIGCSIQEAQVRMDQYMERYPAVAHFFNDAVSIARQTGFAYTLLGRKRAMNDILSMGQMNRFRAERQASNLPIQGSAADIVRAAMIRVDEAKLDERYGYVMFHQVHDELALRGPKDAIQEVSCIVKDCMENALGVDLGVKFTTSTGQGQSWGDAK